MSVFRLASAPARASRSVASEVAATVAVCSASARSAAISEEISSIALAEALEVREG